MADNRRKTQHTNKIIRDKHNTNKQKLKTTNITATYNTGVVSAVKYQLTFLVKSLEKSTKVRESSFIKI
jgi:hypothetical protein